MPRLPRLKLANTPLHIIQRGNNRCVCFGSDEDFLFYLDHLAEICAKVGVAVHAYVLMSNHVHLLATPQDSEGVSQLMKRLGQRYVQHFNRAYRRTGTLWEGRFRSCVVGEETYFLGCQRYIELNRNISRASRRRCQRHWRVNVLMVVLSIAQGLSIFAARRRNIPLPPDDHRARVALFEDYVVSRRAVAARNSLRSGNADAKKKRMRRVLRTTMAPSFKSLMRMV